VPGQHAPAALLHVHVAQVCAAGHLLHRHLALHGAADGHHGPGRRDAGALGELVPQAPDH
ncbi:hypothetical protein BN1723_020696, partial [Verticillium longisporum]